MGKETGPQSKDRGFSVALSGSQKIENTSGFVIELGARAAKGEKSSPRMPKIGVTPDGYDRMSEVLGRLGYRYETVPDASLGSPKRLSQFDVLFLNCSAECDANSTAAASALRDFVKRGGSLYASDYAASYLMSAFPQLLTGARDGAGESIRAKVVDSAVRDLVRARFLDLVFDMSNWFQIKALHARDAKVYLSSENKPLLVSWRFGRGQVLFTSFHNSAQPGAAIQHLMKFLVVRPLVSDERQAAAVIELAQGNLEKFLQLQAPPKRNW